MRKFILLTLILSSVLLFSCGQDKNRVFDYQNSLSRVSGKITENGAEYEAELCFTRDSEERMICRRIEYTAPEEIGGLSFTIEGENVTAELEGVRITDTWFEKEEVFRFGSLSDFPKKIFTR